MKHREQHPLVVKYCPLLPWAATRPDILFTEEGLGIHISDPVLDQHIFKVTYSGGILADEMGLGKTMALFALMMVNPRPKDQVKIFKDTPANHHLISSRATLVICPNHLVKQWEEEINKHRSRAVSVYTLTTINHLKKLTYGAIQQADIIIASSGLFKSTNYIHLETGSVGQANVVAIESCKIPKLPYMKKN